MRKLLYKILKFTCFFIPFSVFVMILVASSTVVTPALEKIVFTHPTELSVTYDRIKGLDTWLETEDTGQRGLIIGGSTVYININPNLLSSKTGIDFYVAANPAQPLLNSVEVLKYCLDNDKKIDYVILSIDHFLWDYKNGLVSSTNWLINDYKPARKHVFNMVANADNNYVWLYYAYVVVKRFLPYTKEYLKINQENIRLEDKGYACYTTNVARADFKPEFIQRRHLSEPNYNALREAIDLCKWKKIKIILFMPKILNSEFDRNELKEIDATILDATPAPVDAKLYYDNFHMQCDGATIYTSWLADEFNKIFSGENNKTN